MNLLRKTPKKLFINSNEKKLSNIRTFWKEIRLYFSNKRNISYEIMLVDKDKNMRKDKNVAEIMNNYFINITKTLTIKSIKNSNINDIMESLSQFND